MPVRLIFRDGTERVVANATAANRDSGLIRISQWNPKRRVLEDLEVIDIAGVAVAEVISLAGVVTSIVNGDR
jgi:hypothetical protein